jgi:hypothetical protein
LISKFDEGLLQLFELGDEIFSTHDWSHEVDVVITRKHKVPARLGSTNNKLVPSDATIPFLEDFI